MAYFTLDWTINPTASSQLVKYRQKGAAMWQTSTGITPANPQDPATVSATVSPVNSNVVYQFQVDAICNGTAGNSAIVEGVIFEDAVVTAVGGAGTINVTQPPSTYIDTIEYSVILSNATVETYTAPGISPSHTFTGLNAGSYTVKYRYSTTINGSTIYSDDATQSDALYQTGSITVT